MDSSMKKLLLQIVLILVLIIIFFNVKGYIFTSIDINTIETPNEITINKKTITDKKEIEEIYDLIRSGKLREEKMNIKITSWGSSYNIKADYSDNLDDTVNTVQNGHIYSFQVMERDRVSFEFYKEDKLIGKNYRVAHIKAEGLSDLIKLSMENKK